MAGFLAAGRNLYHYCGNILQVIPSDGATVRSIRRMTPFSRLLRVLIHALLLNCAVLFVFILFMANTRWYALLDPMAGSGPFLPFSAIMELYASDILIRMVPGILIIAALLPGIIEIRHSAWTHLAGFYAACMAVAALFLFTFRHEFHGGYFFRNPSDNTGYLYPPAIYTSVLVVIGAFVAVLWFFSMALRLARRNDNG